MQTSTPSIAIKRHERMVTKDCYSTSLVQTRTIFNVFITKGWFQFLEINLTRYQSKASISLHKFKSQHEFVFIRKLNHPCLCGALAYQLGTS